MSKAKGRRRNLVALGIVLAWMLLVWQPCTLALDPALDVSQYAHTSWKVREGFFKDAISAIAQTPDGYLWLGTQFGLIRFDGVRAVPWQPSAGQQLPSSYIRSLRATRDGTLWIGTWLGLSSWKDSKLTQHPELAGQSVGRILEDRDGTVWAGTRYPPPGKLCAFRGDGAQCYGDGGEFGERASSLYEDHTGTLWVGGQTGLWRWNPGPPKFYPLADFESSQGLVEIDTGAILIAERRTLNQLIGEKVVPFSLPIEGLRFQPSRLLRDRDGSLWIGTFDRGLVHVHQGRADLFSQFNGLSGNYIRDLFEDREGNIWVATDNGLDRLRHIAVATVSVDQGLSQSTPWSVLTAKDGSVWVGTLDGLNRLRDGQITVYRKQSKSGRPDSAASTLGSDQIQGRDGFGTVNRSATLGPVREITDSGLPDDVIHSLFEDDQRRIWVSTRAGLAYFENDRFIPVSGIPSGVHAIAGDAAGNIWISEDESLILLQGGRVIERFPWTSLGRKVHAIPMLSDPVRGGLWLGFRDGTGLSYFKDGRIRVSYGAAEGLGQGMVGGLQLDADETLWAATEGGLSRLKDGRVNTLTAKNGLPCDGVHWMIEDDDHSFWLDTACGLARIPRSEVEAWAAAVEKDKDTQQKVHATVFDSSDGVRIHASPGGFTPQVGKSPDGRIWFLPWDGISVIDPRRLPFNPLPPPVQIEQVTADGQTYDPTQGLTMPPLVRDLTIDYTALSLVAPEKTRFRYKLEGQDPDWKEVMNEHRVQYSNLAPGSYRFRVMAANNSDVWNEEGAFLDFSIAPAFYQTTWFRVGVGILFLALLCGLYRLRVYRLHRKEKDLRHVVETIPAITWTALPDGSVDFFNRYWQEYTGLSAAAAISGWQAAIHLEDLERYREKWQASLETGKPFEEEARFRRTDGQYRWFLTRAVPLRDPRGKILKWYGIVADIEERERLRQLEAELAHINRVSMLGELTASLAHEIQQPIAGAITNANACRRWLTRDRPDMEEANAAIKRIERDAKRAADIITRLKSFYKKGTPPQSESVNVNQIAGDMLVLLRNEANRHAIVMRMELSADLPKVRADRVQLQQVLMNLMLNGIEAMKETGGDLTIRSQREDRQVLIAVSDTGVGLPVDKKDQIFNSFFTTKTEGTGMGLSICRTIIETHGGKLWAEAGEPSGAVFKFTLPANLAKIGKDE